MLGCGLGFFGQFSGGFKGFCMAEEPWLWVIWAVWEGCGLVGGNAIINDPQIRMG